MIMQTIREELQEYEDEQDNGYVLKTDEELIDMISEFGNGELEFYTLDINRLLVEKQRLVELLNEIYYSSRPKEYYNKQIVNYINGKI